MMCVVLLLHVARQFILQYVVKFVFWLHLLHAGNLVFLAQPADDIPPLHRAGMWAIKVRMYRFWDEHGNRIPVTMLWVCTFTCYLTSVQNYTTQLHPEWRCRMSCCVLLCGVVLCCAVLCCVVLCCVVLCCVVLCRVVSGHVMSFCTRSGYIMSCCICRAMTCNPSHVCCARSCHVMSCHVILCCVM